MAASPDDGSAMAEASLRLIQYHIFELILAAESDDLKELAAVSRALVEVVKASSSIRHERRRVLDEVADAAKDAARQKGLSADAVAAIREAIEGGKEET